MKRSNTMSLGDAIKAYLKAMKLEPKMKEMQLIARWEDVIGKTIARATTDMYINDRKLYIYINSSVIRYELLMLRSEILIRLNQLAGEELITDIIFR
jgi:predicted nucleic acid-binding Zn ribbon protein